MSFMRAATLPGELSGCRVLGCPQSPAAPLVALPPSLSITSMQSPCDEGRRPSTLIMSCLTSPFNALRAAWLRVPPLPCHGPRAVPLCHGGGW